jgi:hypothetical protein
MQMQNKAAISANATQHELVQEAAERQRQEDNAAKRLERVRDQQAYFINPIAMYLVGQALPESTAGPLGRTELGGGLAELVY